MPVIIVLVLILVLDVGHLNVLVLVLVWTQNKANVFVLVLVQDDFISTSMDSSWCWLGLDAGDCIPFLYIEFYIIRGKTYAGIFLIIKANSPESHTFLDTHQGIFLT